MSIVLFDGAARQNLLPLTFASAVADVRIGAFTARERWALLAGEEVFVRAENYLQPLYGDVPTGVHTWVDAAVLPGAELAEVILKLEEGTCIIDDNGLIAGCGTIDTTTFHPSSVQTCFSIIKHVSPMRRLQYPWQVFQWNDVIIRQDVQLIQSKKAFNTLPAGDQYINEAHIFIEEGAEVNCSIINAATGPVYIAKGATVMEGCLIRGPFVLGEGASLKMGTKIYGATTIGPYCTAGGEIKNVVMQAFANKGHDGYLGDSVIGRWCNLGAGSSNSNVKNTGGTVKMWHYTSNSFMPVGMKAGVVMGDYTRTAINTSLNTGTVTGICCNIFDGGLMPKYIPAFSWGGKGTDQYRFDKALEDIANWKKMKHHTLDDAEKAVLKYIFELKPGKSESQ